MTMDEKDNAMDAMDKYGWKPMNLTMRKLKLWFILIKVMLLDTSGIENNRTENSSCTSKM